MEILICKVIKELYPCVFFYFFNFFLDEVLL